jgi:hypothetical protein
MLAQFEEPGATLVVDASKVKRWDELMVAAWIASINENDFERYADQFLEHHINGAVLLKLQVDLWSSRKIGDCACSTNGELEKS